MSQDVISSHEQLSMDEITSPLTAQILDFCDPQLFQETFNQASEVTSASNRCSYVENNSNNNKFPDKSNSCSNQDHEDNNNNNDNGDLSIIFDSQDDYDNDITASIDFSSSIQFPISDQIQDQFDFTGSQQLHQPPNISFGDPLPPPLSVFEEDCLSSVPSYNLGSLNPTSPSCSFLSNPGLPAYMAVTGNMMNTGLSIERSGFYSGSMYFGSDFKPSHDQLMEIQADNAGIFGPDSFKPIFNQGDHHLQRLDGGENQNHLVATPVLPQLGTEITGLDDTNFNKVTKLTPEQRREKIHRYMKKRNERNFSKKIKYACRKTLADSRPRVRGRFAKNDEFCEPNKQSSSGHHEEDYDNMRVNEEEQLVDSLDISSHISGLNSFKCNYPIQSWI